MSTLYAFKRDDVSVASCAGASVVNDHQWDVTAAAASDVVLIGTLPAFHKLEPSRCAILGLLTSANALAAGTFDVFIPDAEGGAASAANTVFDDIAITKDTALYTANSLPLICEGLGSAQFNRPVYLRVNTAITAANAAGKVVVRLASFAFAT